MRVLLCHNYYQQRGGEDQVFEDEARLLETHGHSVVRFTKHNDAIDGMSLASVARNTVWNRSATKELTSLIRTHAPHVMHVTNTFPLISPSIYHAARAANLPVVKSIHNYRLFCAQSMCYRDGASCEDCLGNVPWRAVKYKCYRGSRAGSAVVAATQMLHRWWRTWEDYIDVLCVLSRFSQSKYLAAGFRENQLLIKPNFVSPDPGVGRGQGGYAVFIGRLAGEKGIATLVEGWQKLSQPVPLRIIGDGPQSEIARCAAEETDHIQWLGRCSLDEVYRQLGDAACLVFPSTAYESFPKTLVEALAVGTPTLGAAIGSIPEIVRDGENGHLFLAGDADSLARSVECFFEQRHTWQDMRDQCRADYEQHYTAEANYHQLMGLYEEAIRRRLGDAAVEIAREAVPEQEVVS